MFPFQKSVFIKWKDKGFTVKNTNGCIISGHMGPNIKTGQLNCLVDYFFSEVGQRENLLVSF